MKRVGYDGASYCCRICGKAGYVSAQAVRGHIRQAHADKVEQVEVPVPVPVGGLTPLLQNALGPALEGLRAFRLAQPASQPMGVFSSQELRSLRRAVMADVVRAIEPVLNQAQHMRKSSWPPLWAWFALGLGFLGVWLLFGRDVDHERLRLGLGTMKQGLGVAATVKGLLPGA